MMGQFNLQMDTVCKIINNHIYSNVTIKTKSTLIYLFIYYKLTKRQNFIIF